MRIVEEIDLLDLDDCKHSSGITEALADIRTSVTRLVWPPGADKFTIYPESDKKSGQGNGVRPVRDAFVMQLVDRGWTPELDFPVVNPSSMARFGPLDAAKLVDGKPFVVEWESGNISSSHRSMNKMGLGLVRGVIVGGVLVLPSARLASFLTDRIGNIRELRPYFPVWEALKPAAGYFGVMVIEHDAESTDVPRIRKGTDGRALL